MTSPTFPTVSGPIVIDGPVGPLEASVDLPDGEVTPLPLVVVLCHPLSTEGGSMHNKVVTMAARSLRELGAATVRFNFRSVGESVGSFDHGNGERDDLLAVVAWARQQRPDDALWLAGFSFGAYVSLSAANAVQPDALISIAPPAGRWDFDKIVLPTCPWLVIQGDEDEVVEPQAGVPLPAHPAIVPEGVDGFLGEDRPHTVHPPLRQPNLDRLGVYFGNYRNYTRYGARLGLSSGHSTQTRRDKQNTFP